MKSAKILKPLAAALALVILLLTVFGASDLWPLLSRRGAFVLQETLYQEKQNGPIRFDGRVIDQDGKGVPGATIIGHYSVFLLRESLQGRTFTPHPVIATSDKDGYFTVRNLTGQELVWEDVQAPGYICRDQAHSYTYYNDAPPIYKPNPAAPEIFHVWRDTISPADNLTNVHGRMGSPALDSTFSAWLKTDMLIKPGLDPEADLQFTLHHDPIPPNDYAHRTAASKQYNWSFSIDVPHGGIIQTKDAYLYQAPTDGYKLHYEFHRLATDPLPVYVDGNQSESSFYVKCRDGQVYAALRITSQMGAGFDIVGSMNDQASTNLLPAHP